MDMLFVGGRNMVSIALLKTFRRASRTEFLVKLSGRSHNDETVRCLYAR
jgi:3-deoxy-D-arabino-heptulosonate 7-phosphate (DAHP) synthase